MLIEEERKLFSEVFRQPLRLPVLNNIFTMNNKESPMKKFHFQLILTLGLFFLVLIFSSCRHRLVKQNRWETAIQNFEKQDKAIPPPQEAVLFVGSSSIRKWTTLAEDFPGIRAINRGFGGSEYSDLIHFADRIIFPYLPKIIVVYSGDNDIANGKSPAEVFTDFKAFGRLVKKKLPQIQIVVIAIKPSLNRWQMVSRMRQTNQLIKNYCQRNSFLHFVDIDTPMIGDNGMPKADLFVKDGLHLNRKGYRLWTKMVSTVLKNLLN